MPSESKPTRRKRTPRPKTDEQVSKESFAKGAQLPVEEPAVCGHINKQFFNKDGRREDLACTLPAGHEGDHFAKFEHVVTEYGLDENNLEVVTGQHIETDDGFWSDSAGVFPVAKVISQEEDFERLKAARVRERGTDPDVSEKIDKEVRATYGGQ